MRALACQSASALLFVLFLATATSKSTAVELEANFDLAYDGALSQGTSLPSCEGSVNYDSFKCLDGRWTHEGSLVIAERSLRISSNRAALVTGDISIASGLDITLVGEHAGVGLTGCISSLGSYGLHLDYSAGWPQSDFTWTQLALKQNSSCQHHIAYLIKTPKGCTRATETVAYSTSVLRITFTTSHSTCKIIIALSIVGAAAALLVIGGGVLMLRRFLIKRRRTGYLAINE